MTYLIKEDDISILPLSVRSMNCLRGAQIMTVGALLDYPVEDLMKIRNMGQKSVDEIQSLIQQVQTGSGEFQLVEHREEEAASEQCREPASETGEMVFVEDIPVKNMGLSVRAINCLTNAGIQTASQLIQMTEEDLLKMRNMGKKTASELLEKITYLKQHNLVCAASERICTYTPEEQALAQEVAAVYDQPVESWLREILAVKDQFPEVQGETLLFRLYDREYVYRSARSAIVKLVEAHGDEISKNVLSEKMPRHLSNTTIVEDLLLDLERHHLLTVGEVMVKRKYPSILDYVAHQKDERERDVLQSRLKGKTLQDVADQYGITRERVRQIETKALKNRPRLQEDQYAYLYQQYDFSLEDFLLAFEEPPETYHYLEMQCKAGNRKHKPIEDILTDTAVPAETRRRAERAIYKQYVLWDGVRVKKTRPEMMKHAVKVFCKSLTKYDDFIHLYHMQLEELGLADDPKLISDTRTYENILNKCDYALWSQWRYLRYYNIPEYDFEELLSTLDLEKYEDTIFSSLKLFRDYPELMQQYDIQDEYELHNLLKKIWPQERSDIHFKKMPTIEIGTGDTDSQVLSLLLQYAPISAMGLAEKYEAEYGVKVPSALSNLFKNFSEYYYNGIYSIDYVGLPPEQHQHMREILTEDFYTMKEAKRLYLREFPNGDLSLINPYTLKLLGFHIYPGFSGYLVKNSYSSATDYFNKLLTGQDLVDMRERIADVRYIVTYSQEQYRLRQEYEIIEYSPLQYIHIRRLNAAGITKQHLADYCAAAARVVEKGDYFTIHSLREDGFTHGLDVLGFEEWFYASILVENTDHFSYWRVGGTRIFVKGKPKAEFTAMLTWILEQNQRMDIYDMVDLLNIRYGISMSREQIIQFVHATDLYYDTIMETVYIDYDTYFEEI